MGLLKGVFVYARDFIFPQTDADDKEDPYNRVHSVFQMAGKSKREAYSEIVTDHA